MREAARFVDLQTATVDFARWLARTWELDPNNPTDARFIRFEALVFNEILAALRAEKIEWTYVIPLARKAYTDLKIHASKRGKVKADERLDLWLGAIGAAVAARVLGGSPEGGNGGP